MPTSRSIESTQAELKPVRFDVVRRLLLRKLWLPRFLYEALPYIYIGCGLASLLAAIYAPGWMWILPYAALTGLIGLHAGITLVTLRYRFRRGRKKSSGD